MNPERDHKAWIIAAAVAAMIALFIIEIANKSGSEPPPDRGAAFPAEKTSTAAKSDSGLPIEIEQFSGRGMERRGDFWMIDQPPILQAGTNYAENGFFYDKPIAGDVVIEATLDLERSDLRPPPDGVAQQAVFILQAELGRGERGVQVLFVPASRPGLRGKVGSSLGGGSAEVPLSQKTLILRLTRFGNEVEAEAGGEGGEQISFGTFDFSGFDDARDQPITKIKLTALLSRGFARAGEPVRGQGAYAVADLSVRRR